MAKKETEEKIEPIVEEESEEKITHEEVDVEVPIAEEEIKTVEERKTIEDLEKWHPKTSLGKRVKNKEITDIDDILDAGQKILEDEIVTMLLPNLETDLLLIGQSKGKFGGGQRRIFRQTQKKTCEGNKPKFGTMAIVGNRDGYLGLGYGKSKETVPAREKSIRDAKLNVIKIRRGCGSWECDCNNPHSIPFAIEGKCGSIRMKLMPAPKGTGLVIEKECAKMLAMVGIKDVWSQTFGHTKTKINVIKACFDAMRKLMQTKVSQRDIEKMGIVEGRSGL